MTALALNRGAGRTWALLVACFYGILFSPEASAANRLAVKECALEPGKATGEYILRLRIGCLLENPGVATVKVAIDPKEEKVFETVGEEKVRRGAKTVMNFEIPVSGWWRSTLNVYVFMEGRNSKQGELPLASLNRVVPRPAKSLEPR